MAYLCLDCGELYNELFSYCPKRSCLGNVVEIDDLMVPIIQTLNNKGYSTEYCCSGHALERNSTPYVAFSLSLLEDYTQEELELLFARLPSPWKIDWTGSPLFSFSINATITTYHTVDRYKEICKANMKLLDFVVTELPAIGY